MKKNISIFIVLTLVFQIAIAQSDKPTYDSPGNYGDPAIEKAKGKDKEVDFYIPGSRDQDTKKTPNPFGEDMPEGIDGAGDGYTGGQGSDVPDYFTDREFDRSIESGSEISFETFDGEDSGDGEGSEGGQGSNDSGALSGGDFDVGDGEPSLGTSKDKSSSGFGNDFGYENHRGSDGVPKNGQAGRVSRSYPELIQKGRRAARIVENKSSQVRQIRVRIESGYQSSKDAVDQNPAKDFYESGDRVIAGRDLTLEMVKKMAAYKNFSLNDLLVPFSKILMKTQTDFDKYQKKLIADELDKSLPGLRQKNLGSLIRSREMIKNWKIAQAKIKEALFNDLFDQTQTATQNLEDQMNFNYMGTFDAKFADFLKNQELQGRYRLSEYISSFLTEINPYQNGAQQVPQGLQEAIKLLKEADDIVRNNGDTIVAADKILEAKENVKFVSGKIEDSHPEDWFAAAGLARTVGKGLVKYGMKKALQNFVKDDSEALAIKIIGDYERLAAGKGIWYGPHSPGLLHEIEFATGKQIASTFGGSVYKVVKTDNPLKLYRAFVDEYDLYGSFWSFQKPTGTFNVYFDNAIDPAWTKGLKYNWIEIEVPANTEVYIGKPNWIKTKNLGIYYPANKQTFINFKNEIEAKKLIELWKTDSGKLGKK